MFEPGELYAKKLPPPRFVATLRYIENVALETESPVFVYYSVKSAGRMLPKGPKVRDLLGQSGCVSIFSQDQTALQDECAFWAFTTGGCIYFNIAQVEPEDSENYWCSGSIDNASVLFRLSAAIETFRTVEEQEVDRLLASIKKYDFQSSSSELFLDFQRLWNGSGGSSNRRSAS